MKKLFSSVCAVGALFLCVLSIAVATPSTSKAQTQLPSIELVSQFGTWEIGKAPIIEWKSHNMPKGGTVLVRLQDARGVDYRVISNVSCYYDKNFCIDVNAGDAELPPLSESIAPGYYRLKISCLMQDQSPCIDEGYDEDVSDGYFTIVQSRASTIGNFYATTQPVQDRYVAAGTQQAVLGNIRLNAIGSKEDIRLNNIKLQMLASSVNLYTPAGISNCKLYDGSSALNQDHAVWLPDNGIQHNLIFAFDSPYILLKNTQKDFSVRCDTGSSTDRTYQWGINPITPPSMSAYGVTSGKFIIAGMTASNGEKVIVGPQNFKPSVTIVSPNKGEQVKRNSPYTIKWNSQQLPSDIQLSIYLEPLRNENNTTYLCSHCYTIADHIKNTGTFEWDGRYGGGNVPAYDLVDNQKVKITITAFHPIVGDVVDQSDDYFFLMNSATSTSTSQIISRLDPSSPVARTAAISPSVVTDNVVLGVFDFKSQTKDATLRSIKFKVWTSTSTVQTVFGALKIKIGSTLYYPTAIAQTGSYAEVTFTGLAAPMPASVFIPITVYGAVAADRTGLLNGLKTAVNILASNSTVYADDSVLIQVPVFQNNLTSADTTFATTITKSITLNKLSLASTYRVGDIVPIKWTSTGVTNVAINLLNYKGTSIVRFIGTSTASVGQYNWKVPANIDFDYDTIYMISVADAANPNLISKSGKIELLPVTPTPSVPPFVGSTTATYTLIGGGAGGSTAANILFGFQVGNRTGDDIYISKNGLTALTTSINPNGTGSVLMFSLVVTEPGIIAGDTSSAYIVPAGTFRMFKYSGQFDNSHGTAGFKSITVSKINYGLTASNPTGGTISSGLTNLAVSMNLDGASTPPTTPPSIPTPPPPVISPTTPNPTSPVVTPTPVVTTPPTILAWTGPSSIRTGETLQFTLNWSGGPFATSPHNGEEWKIFLHLRQKNGVATPVSTGFYSDPLPSKWGTTKQTPGSVLIPAGTPAGEYDVLVGMYVGSYNYQMTPGAGVTNVGSSNYSIYKVGTITVSQTQALQNRPWMTLLPPTGLTALILEVVERLSGR